MDNSLSNVKRIQIKTKLISVHEVNIAHYRLVQLTHLADLAKPFYDWVEKLAQKESMTVKNLNDILLEYDEKFINKLITTAFKNENMENVPVLFDGAGRTYQHKEAVFLFFGWLIRDAPKQRLAGLITKMLKIDKSKKCHNNKLSKQQAQIDTLSKLFVTYRKDVKTFSWESVREVFIDRLEGSRRSIRGHIVENNARMAITEAFQTYYTSHSNYGNYSAVKVDDKQIKIGNDTIDVHVTLTKKGGNKSNIYIPVKSRETQGGGHAHLFSRDIITAINDIRKGDPNSHFAAVIIAENWDPKELKALSDLIDIVFYFDINPDQFENFDENSQLELNKYIQDILEK